MQSSRARNNWIIDAILFTGFILLFFVDLTGVELHQWLGIAGIILALYHLLEHWDWVLAVSQRFFGRTTWIARLYYLVDAALLLGFAAILVSGLAISTWLSPSFENLPAWIDFHITTSIITLLILLVKIVIHWRWIVKTARGLIPRPATPTTTRSLLRPLAAPIDNNRRDFLKLMGFVGAAAVLAMLNVASSTGESEGVKTFTQSLNRGAATTGQATTQDSSGQSRSSSSTCLSRCPKGCSCSNPGHCRQYTDANQNGRCDLGECV